MLGMNRWLRHTLQMMALMLALAGCVPLQAAAPRPSETPLQTHTLDATRDDSPTWETLGLEDLLAPASECSTAAPQSVPAHYGGTTAHCCAHYAAHQPLPATRKLHSRARRPHRANDYYLYFLYRLRL